MIIDLGDDLNSDWIKYIARASSYTKESKVIIQYKVGTATSGNFRHAGRPGKIGGSAPSKDAQGYHPANYHRYEDLPSSGSLTITPHWKVGSGDEGAEDKGLKAILHDQGFDGPPDVISKEEMDAYVAAGEQEIWRGINCGFAEVEDRAISIGYAEQFINGELFAGRGVYGGGTYAADVGEAIDFAGFAYGTPGAVVRMTIRKGAKIVEYSDDLRKKAFKYGDNGWYAAAKGYDVIHVPDNGRREEQWVILNRTAIRVERTIYEEDRAMYALRESHRRRGMVVNYGRYKFPDETKEVKEGNANSGNFGHAGRLGKVGGSAPGRRHVTVKAKYTNPADIPSSNGRYDVTNYNGPQDDVLRAICHDQGFDGPPDVMTREEMDAHIASSGEVVMYRGINADNPEDGEYWGQQYIDGGFFVGRGTYGNGVYTSLDPFTATIYATSSDAVLSKTHNGFLLRMTLKKDAKVISRNELKKRMEKDDPTTPAAIANDPGRYAAAHGYDAVQINSGLVHIYIILNRTATRVQDTNYLARYMNSDEWRRS